MDWIDSLSNNDITKHEEVLDLYVIHCFNTMEYRIERDKVIEEKNKRGII